MKRTAQTIFLGSLAALSGCGSSDPCEGLELGVSIRDYGPSYGQRFGIADDRRFNANLMYEVRNTLNEPRLFRIFMTDPQHNADLSEPQRIDAKSIEHLEGHEINTSSGRSFQELSEKGWRFRLVQCQ